jgi:hypothetical protein
MKSVYVILFLVMLVGVASAETMTLYADNSSASSTAFSLYHTQHNSTFSSLVLNETATGRTYSVLYVWVNADTLIDEYQEIDRGVIIFPTGDLPDGATITSAKIGLKWRWTSYNQMGENFTITQFSPVGDANALDNYNNFGTTHFITETPILEATSDYVNYTLNSDGIATISPTSNTMFGIRIVNDITNTAPSWIYKGSDIARFETKASNATGYPYLEIEYTPSSSSSSTPVSPTGATNNIVTSLNITGLGLIVGGIVGLLTPLFNMGGIAGRGGASSPNNSTILIASISAILIGSITLIVTYTILSPFITMAGG